MLRTASPDLALVGRGRATRRASLSFLAAGLCAAAVLVASLPAPVAAQGAPAPIIPTTCARPFPKYAPAPVATEVTTSEHEIVMSDGVVLRADVTLPVGVAGPLPTVFSITGYNKAIGGSAFGGGGGGLALHGYATVLLDDRGTGTSGGGWDSWGERTQADYPEVIDWIVNQSWSNGDVALAGSSYVGITSLFAAASGHPAVKAVFATVPMGDAYRDIVFAGSQVNAAFVPLWMGLVTGLGAVPSSDPTTVVDHLLNVPSFQLDTVTSALLGSDATYNTAFWRQRSPIDVVDQIKAPTFIVGGLDDLFQRGEPMLYEALAAHGNDARLLIGPWNHLTTGQGLPRDGVPSLDALTLQWFDHHLRGIDTGVECIPPVTQYITGAERYMSAPSWPIPGLTAERWHLRGDGTLTADAPTGPEASRQYLQLPITGPCTRSTNQWLIGVLGETPCASDNRLDEALSLTYTTDPFPTDVRIDGPIEADLWLEAPLGGEALTSVAISSVAPDGTSRGLTNGLLRASHRAVDKSRSRMLDGQSIQPWHPFTEAAVQDVPAGEPMFVPVEVFPTSAVIPAGHRLRVTVAAYDVPHALPPLPSVVATLAGPVTVLNDAAHPSSVVIPVVGASNENADGPPTSVAIAVPAGDASPGPGLGDGSSSDRLPSTGAGVPLALAAAALALGLLGRRATT